MKDKNMLTAALVLTACSFATHATAGPCDEGIALVNPLTNMLEIPGIDIGNGEIIDAMVELAGGELIVRGMTPGSSINPSNRFNPSTSQVELDCVIFNQDTFDANLNVFTDGNDLKLQVADAINVFDPSLTRDWTLNYNNEFEDEVVMFSTLNRVTIPGSLGNSETSGDQITLSFGFGDFTSTFKATVAPGKFSGTFNHREQFGTFVARPTNPRQTVGLNDGRFLLSGVWTNDTGSGPADAILATDDSAAFFFSDPDKVDTRVRVFDGCAINNHYWVFAAATTNVEYTLTVTDTSTGTEKIYNNNLGTPWPAVTDTEAFATCP